MHHFERDAEAGDAFVSGFYLHVRRGAVSLPVSVWFGPLVDLENDEPVMDRSWRWQRAGADELVDDERVADPMFRMTDVWPRALAHPIDEQEYEYLMERIRHARGYMPSSPYARRKGRIDPLTAELPF